MAKQETKEVAPEKEQEAAPIKDPKRKPNMFTNTTGVKVELFSEDGLFVINAHETKEIPNNLMVDAQRHPSLVR